MRNLSGTGVVLVALGGAAGSVLRYLAGVAWPADTAAGAIPWATLAVNVLGTFMLGTLLGAAPAGHAGHAARLLVGTGLCGGFTTFSTFAVEGVALAEGGAAGRATGYVLGSVALGLLAAAGGVAFGRRLG